MWGWILAAIAIVVGFLVLPGLLVRLPRDERGGGGGLGPALSELNAIFDPGRRHVEAARRQLPAERTPDEPRDD